MPLVLPDITEQPHTFIFSPKCHISRPPKSKTRTEFGAKLLAVEFFKVKQELVKAKTADRVYIISYQLRKLFEFYQLF